MANLPLSSLPGLGVAPASGDLFYVVDVSDTSESPQGTSKKIQYDILTAGSITADSVATLTNKTINGNSNTLTVLAATQLSGITPVANGGTGLATLTSGSVLVGNGTSAVTLVATTGSSSFVRANSPTLVTPVLGAATATSINGLTVDTTTGTFDLTNGKTLAVTNTLTLSGTDGTIMTFPNSTQTIAGLSSTQTMSNKTLSSPVVEGIVTGWVNATDTWTYASATTFTIASVDRTTTFTPGTRIKLTQTSVKYFVVVSSSFSTNTTVTVTGGTDYTLANAAITSPAYSYEANPQGYPGVFNYTTVWTGFSADPTSANRFSVIGRTCFVNIYSSVVGVSNSTGLTFTLPIASAYNLSGIPMGATHNNSTSLTTLGVVNLSATSTTATAYPGPDQGGWTNSNNKSLQAAFNYPI